MTNTATVIDFGAWKNAKRAEDVKAEAAKQKAETERERIAKAAEAGFRLGAILGKEPEQSLNAALNMAALEAEKIKQEKAKETYTPAYCDPDNEFRGSQYDATKDLPLKEVAKRIRADIKRMIRAGTLPRGLKVSVRTEHHNAIRLNITALPEGLRVYTPDYARATRNFTQPADRHNGFDGETHTPEYQAIRQALDANTQSYNRDNSDSMTDYFAVRFYDGRAGLHWEFERQVRAAESVALESCQP